MEEKVQSQTKALAEANLQLQQSNLELNQFAYIASHDLQEPIRKIQTFTQLLEVRIVDGSDKTKNYISKVQRSAARMKNLIDDVLQFSLLLNESEKREEIDLNKVLHFVLEDYELFRTGSMELFGNELLLQSSIYEYSHCHIGLEL